MIPVARSCEQPPAFLLDTLANQKSVGVKLLTLAIVRSCTGNGKVLLGLKKRGFGAGYYNGFGGKVESGETILQATCRELHEEAGITAKQLVQRGILTFVFDDQPKPWEVHVFDVTEYSGEPTESEEMQPVWLSPAELPFDRMWADDRLWYPLFLSGGFFQGLFGFMDTHTMLWHNLVTVPASKLGMPAQALLLPTTSSVTVDNA